MSKNNFEINNMDKLNIGDHTVLLYEHEKDTLFPLVSFIKSSLRRGEKCLYIEGDSNTGLIIDILEKEVKNLRKHIESRQFQFLSKEEAYASNNNFKADRMIEKIKKMSFKSFDEGYTGLSITGELSWILYLDNSKEELIKYETNLNDEVFDNYPVVALCRYNINKFDKRIIRFVIESHKYIIWNNKLQDNPLYIDPEN